MRGPTIASSTDGAIGRPSLSIDSSVSSTVLPCSRASMSTDVMRVSTRLTTKPGASPTTTARLRNCFVSSHAVASASSLVASVRTISTSGMTATGLKKCSPTSAPIAATESDDVFVARMQSSPTTPRSSAKTCCFTVSSSKTASSTRSQPARSAMSVVPVIGHQRSPSSSLTDATALSTVSCSRSRITSGTPSRLRNSVASCVAMRPAPTMPIFSSLRGATSGTPTPFFARRSTTSYA